MAIYENMDSKEITEDQLDTLEEQMGLFGSFVWREITSDSQPFSKSFDTLISDYNRSTPDQRKAINNAMICVLGWQVTTLVKNFLELPEDQKELLEDY